MSKAYLKLICGTEQLWIERLKWKNSKMDKTTSFYFLRRAIPIILLICFGFYISHSQNIKRFQNPLNFPFEVEKEIAQGNGKLKRQKIYIYLDEIYFSKDNLKKLFLHLSENNSLSPLSVIVFSNKEMLAWKISGDSRGFVDDFDTTPDGKKAEEQFFNRYYPPDTGYFRAFYSRNQVSEYYAYSPQKDAEQLIKLTFRDNSKFEETEDFLLNSIKTGYKDAINWYLSQTKQVNFKDKDGKTPLMWAIMLHHNEVAKNLIDYGIDINAVDTDGNTALMYASSRGNHEGFKLLVNNKARVDFVNKVGQTILMAGVFGCNEEIVKNLLRLETKLDRADKDGITALMYACDNKEVIKTFLRSGANPNLPDKKGWTALFHAVNDGFVNKVEALIEYGVSLELKNEDGLSILIFAEKQKNHNKSVIVEILKKYGAK